MSTAQTSEDAKRLSTLTARAALKGIIIHRVEGDYFAPEIFVASKWALTREFTDMDALDAWLTLVTGKPA